MAASVDTIPPPQLSIARIARRLDVGLADEQHVVDLIIDYLLEGDRSRWFCFWRGPGWEAGNPPLSRMALEDYLDFLESIGRHKTRAEFMPWARQQLAECVLLEAHEFVEILQALELPVTPWVEMWQASFSPWSTAYPLVEAMGAAWYELNNMEPPPPADHAAFSLECDRRRLTGDALTAAWGEFNRKERARRAEPPTPAQTTPPRRGRPPTVDEDEITRYL